MLDFALGSQEMKPASYSGDRVLGIIRIDQGPARAGGISETMKIADLLSRARGFVESGDDAKKKRVSFDALLHPDPVNQYLESVSAALLDC